MKTTGTKYRLKMCKVTSSCTKPNTKMVKASKKSIQLTLGKNNFEAKCLECGNISLFDYKSFTK